MLRECRAWRPLQSWMQMLHSWGLVKGVFRRRAESTWLCRSPFGACSITMQMLFSATTTEHVDAGGQPVDFVGQHRMVAHLGGMLHDI